jgi:hypothetical protein
MVKKKKEQGKELFYVGVRDPTEVRRNLLESSRELVVFLKTYENFKRIRIQKVEEINKLKLLINQISRTINKLRRDLPKTKLREKSEETIKKGGERRIVKMPVKVKAMSDVERLESELTDIEEKLKLL